MGYACNANTGELWQEDWLEESEADSRSVWATDLDPRGVWGLNSDAAPCPKLMNPHQKAPPPCTSAFVPRVMTSLEFNTDFFSQLRLLGNSNRN